MHKISAKIDWLISNTTDGWWVGYSPALKITAQALSREELDERINETQKALFGELGKTGKLETFLAVQDWVPEIGHVEQVDAGRIAAAAC